MRQCLSFWKSSVLLQPKCSFLPVIRGLSIKTTDKLVIMSKSNDIFQNLALEDWLYQHQKFNHQQVLLLWRNSPCVVIGRHQNPWLEANVPFLREQGIRLARRNSGGGTVFHDQGNINCSFFTSKADYRRIRNLQLICEALKKTVGVDVSVNDRDDIVLDGTHKISGTAAKLGRETAYHHCTVLVDVRTNLLHEALNHPTDLSFIQSRATKSVKAPVKNLVAKNNMVNIEKLEISIAEEFLDSNDFHIEEVDPNESVYPGLENIRNNYESWDWVFGKTPEFTINKSFSIPLEIHDDVSTADLPHIECEMVIKSGKVKTFKVTQPFGMMDPDFCISHLLEGKFLTSDIVWRIGQTEISQIKKTFLSNCIAKMIEDIL